MVTTGGRLADAARDDGVPVIPLPAGLQPRAAVAYMLVAALEVAALSRRRAAHPDRDRRCRVVARGPRREWGPDADSDSLAKRVAQRVHKTCVCVYGAGPTAPIAYRWKTQINENAKVPAFCGGAARGRPQRDRRLGERRRRWAASWRVFLEDSDQHPRVRQRIELTAALIEPQAAGTLRLESQGANPVERVLSLVLLGDLVSIYLAVLRGVDPTPVP